VPNGIVLEDFRPTKLGPDFELTRILKPLEKFRSDLMVIGGLDDHNGNALGDGPGDHARAGAAFLTGVHCKKTAGRRHSERHFCRSGCGSSNRFEDQILVA
jgi:hypothetical protein